MNETRTTGLVFPEGRYGHRRDPRRRRWVPYVVGLVVLVAGVAVSVKLYLQYGAPTYEVRLVSVAGYTERQVTVVFDVRGPAGEKVVCTVRARNRAGAEVGRAEVEVPVSTEKNSWVRVTYTLTTSEPPFIGEVPGCGPASPPRPPR